MKTLEATEGYKRKKRLERENRKSELLKMIRKNDSCTAYSLSRLANLPISSVQNLIKELESEMEIKIEDISENGRQKKIIKLMTIDDFIHDYFNFASIDHPMTLRLMRSARNKNMPITFRMENGDEKILNPNESLEDFKEKIKLK